MSPNPCHHGRCRGFSLLEVLVALFVLSIGLLGLAGLQTFGFKFNQQSYERTQATLLIYDIIDRMRANPNGLASYARGFGTALTAPSINCATTACPAATAIAAFDLYQWRRTIQSARMLPSGDGAITFNGSLATVSVRWQENGLNVTQGVTVQIL